MTLRGRKLLAELLGTAFLLMGVVGSGIMAQRVSPGDEGMQLLQNAFATAGVLVAIILALGPVSGAHINPAVTLADRWFGGMDNRDAAGYVVAQLVGAVLGVMAANLMFGLDAVSIAEKARTGADVWFAEGVATFGLLLVVFGVVRSGRGSAAPFAVGAYIAGAYYFTSSTSFANPAVTVARTLTDTFTGIAPADAPAFLAAELTGVVAAVIVVRLLYPTIDRFADEVVVPHPSGNGRGRAPAPGVDTTRDASQEGET